MIVTGRARRRNAPCYVIQLLPRSGTEVPRYRMGQQIGILQFCFIPSSGKVESVGSRKSFMGEKRFAPETQIAEKQDPFMDNRQLFDHRDFRLPTSHYNGARRRATDVSLR